MNKAEIEAHRKMLIVLCKEKDKEIKELQQRIDKAIEYIKAMQNNDLIFTTICEKELLEILGDKENE